MHPSATAERTAGGESSSALRSAAVAGSLPIRPKATATAEATSASLSLIFSRNTPTDSASPRTPIELITPTSSLPLSDPAAVRSASPADGSGIASSGMRAHEASCSSDKSLATSGTQALLP